MKILIKPDDIIKRCLWDSYVYYILDTEDNAEKILKENKEFEISERDALIIGLLKVIETDNLIHKFNMYITEILTNKSTKNKNLILIRKRAIESGINKFLNKFPDYWSPEANWVVEKKELIDYINKFEKGLEKLEIHEITYQNNIVSELYSSNKVKKLLKFNY